MLAFLQRRPPVDTECILALTDRHTDELEQQAAKITGSGVRVLALPADLRDLESLDALVSRAEAELGPIDILVNNAAVARLAPFTEFDDLELQEIVNVNLLAPMILTRRLLPGMIERGRGHVVTMASLEGQKGSTTSAKPDRVGNRSRVMVPVQMVR